MRLARYVLVFALGVASGVPVYFLIRSPVERTAGTPRSSAVSALEPDSWRWQTDEEGHDVYVPGPCPPGTAEHPTGLKPGTTCERGIAPWRLGPGNREKRDREIEWVFARHPHANPVWMPARSDLDPARIVVFDGFRVKMAGVPAGGRNLGTIRQEQNP